MRAIPFIIFSIFVGGLIAVCAWPVFVASGGLISLWQGEGSILDDIKNRLTWIIAGLSLPAACVGLLFTFYKDPAPLLPTFVMTGVCLFILYRFADLLRRLFSR